MCQNILGIWSDNNSISELISSVFSPAGMEELVCELRLFLDLLDREYLTAGVREKKVHLSNILNRVLADKGDSTWNTLTAKAVSGAVCTEVVFF